MEALLQYDWEEWESLFLGINTRIENISGNLFLVIRKGSYLKVLGTEKLS